MTLGYKTRFAVLLATTLSILTSASSVTAEGRERGPRMDMHAALTQFDLNDDGALTLAEIQEAQTIRFTTADLNGDGSLSADELAQQIASDMQDRSDEMAEKMLGRMDANEDGMLSAEEIAFRNIDRMFGRIDADDDGILSAEELERLKGRKGRHSDRG